MRSFTLLLIIASVIALVVWNLPFTSASDKPPSLAYKGFKIVTDRCKSEMREISVEEDISWDEQGAELYCLCMSSTILSANETEEELLSHAKALVSSKDVFRAFMFYDVIVESCAPKEVLSHLNSE